METCSSQSIAQTVQYYPFAPSVSWLDVLSSAVSSTVQQSARALRLVSCMVISSSGCWLPKPPELRHLDRSLVCTTVGSFVIVRVCIRTADSTGPDSGTPQLRCVERVRRTIADKSGVEFSPSPPSLHQRLPETVQLQPHGAMHPADVPSKASLRPWRCVLADDFDHLGRWL